MTRVHLINNAASDLAGDCFVDRVVASREQVVRTVGDRLGFALTVVEGELAWDTFQRRFGEWERGAVRG